MRMRALFCALVAPALALGQPASEGTPASLTASLLRGLSWRSVGPAAMGGRIVDLAVVEDKPSTFYFAAATGGIWKTTNAGTTFEPVFDDQGVGSVGAVAVARSDPQVVWAGTGEANARNSCSYGDGVYKSTDAGATWTPMGLQETRHVGRIAIHPTDPNVVFVAAVGHVWAPNPMRGLYRTIDGGETWSQVLAIDDDTGCIDVLIDPVEPNRVYAAAYEVRRDGLDGNDPAERYGERAGIFRSLDGGNTWSRCTDGLPTVKYGRVGLTLCRTRPEILFAVVETEFTGRPAPAPGKEEGKREEPPTGPAYMGVRSEPAGDDAGARVIEIIPDSGAAQAEIKADDVITRVGEYDVRDYDSLIEAIRAHKAGDTVDVTLIRDEETRNLELTFGAQRGQRVVGTLGGQGANAMDRQGATGWQTGGVFRSEDHGATWVRVNSLTPRPFYYSQIRVDPLDPDNLWVLGTQLHRSKDGGKKFTPDGASGIHVDHHAMWIDPADPRHLILGNDGGLCVSWDRGRNWDFLAAVPLGQYYGIALDDRNPYRIYGGCQDNGSWGFPSRVRSTYGLTNAHTYKIGSGDGFQCAVDPTDDDIVFYESQNGNIRYTNVATGEGGRVQRPGQGGRGRIAQALGARGRFRFNWETPFLLSPHTPRMLYFAGNKVFRSTNRGANSKEISPEITATDKGSATSLAESPAREGVLWVGTDDGSLWVTRDGGAEWTDISENLPALARAKWVTHIEPSRKEAGGAWVVLDGHRQDDLAPYVFKTSDFGETFESISAGLPQAPVRVLRQDPRSDDLLYVGTEIGVWISLDAGSSWTELGEGLPTVPVHDLRIHPRERELVAGTHGRSIWIIDVAPLQDLRPEYLANEFFIFTPKDAVKWIARNEGTRYGRRGFRARNPPTGAALCYWLGREPKEGEEVSIAIHDALGNEVSMVRATDQLGINRVTWTAGRGRGGPGGRRRGGDRGGGDGGGRGRERRGGFEPGTYKVTVSLGNLEASAPLKVLPDPVMAEQGAAAGASSATSGGSQ